MFFLSRGWILSIRLIGRYPTRSIGTVRGVMIPIILIVALFGMINGLSEEMRRVTDLAGHSDYLMIIESGSISFSSSRMAPSVLVHIRNHSNVLDVLPQRVAPCRISADGEAWIETEIWSANLLHLIQFWGGMKLFTLSSTQLEEEAIIGSSLAFRLGILEPNLPEILRVVPLSSDDHEDLLEVWGTLETKRRYQMALMVSEQTFVNITGESQDFISMIEIRVRNPTQARATAMELEALLRANSLSCDVSPEGASQELVDLAKRDILRVFWFLVLFSLVIVLVQVYFSVHWLVERSEHDIWLLHVLGSSRFEITSVFVVIAMILGNLALIGGTTIGILLLLSILSTISAILGGQSTVTGLWTFEGFFLIAFLVNLSILIGSVYPSWTATRKKHRETQFLFAGAQ